MILFGTVIRTKKSVEQILEEADLSRKKGEYVNEDIYNDLKEACMDSFLGLVTYPSRIKYYDFVPTPMVLVFIILGGLACSHIPIDYFYSVLGGTWLFGILMMLFIFLTPMIFWILIAFINYTIFIKE